MKSVLIVLALMFALAGGASADQSDKSKKATETLEKMRQLDLLNQLLPLVMTKDQIRQLLPSIEKARRDVKAQEDMEADLISKYAARVDEAVKNGTEKGDVPDKQFLKELNALVMTMSIKRNAVISDNTDLVLDQMKKVLNAGQIKAAANSLSPSIYLPGYKPEELTDEMKLKVFVREIMLDPLAYDILVKIQKSTG